MRLVLIRHGRTSSNVNGALDTGRPGASLDAVGRGQAQDAADRWPETVGAEPDAVAVSPLRRTRQTAAPLLERFGADAMIRPGVREIRAGDLEMNADPESGMRYGLTVMRWTLGDLDRAMPGGETGHQVLDRALPVVDEVLRRAWRAGGSRSVGVIVAHGSVLRLLMGRLAADLPAWVPAWYPLGNARTSVLEWQARRDRPDHAGSGAEVSPRTEWPATPREWLGSFRAVTWDEQSPDQWRARTPLPVADADRAHSRG